LGSDLRYWINRALVGAIVSHYGCADAQAIKFLTVVNEYVWKYSAIGVPDGIGSRRVIYALNKLVGVCGVPRRLRMTTAPQSLLSSARNGPDRKI